MKLTRRETMRLIGFSAAGLTVYQAMGKLTLALNGTERPPSLVWINEGGSDLGLLGLIGQRIPEFMELVTLQWNLHSHAGIYPTLAKPDTRSFPTAPILILETVPAPARMKETAPGGLLDLLKQAKAVILLGTEACYGGFTTPPAQVANFEDLCRSTRTPVIKLPGVPAPPHHLVGTLAHLETFGFPKLDSLRRPKIYYDETVCERCERRRDLDLGNFAYHFGEPGCLYHLGCKGLVTHNSCAKLRWNNGENWCVGAGGPCSGCSEPGYPNHGGLGLFGPLNGKGPASGTGLWGNMNSVSYGLLGLIGLGMGVQLVRRFFFPGPLDPPAASPPQRKG